jgi:hypothetical protein
VLPVGRVEDVVVLLLPPRLVLVVGPTVVVVVVLPQPGGVGTVAVLHVALPARKAAAHAERHSLPARRLGHSVRHALSSVLKRLLQSLGHRAAEAVMAAARIDPTSATRPMRRVIRALPSSIVQLLVGIVDVGNRAGVPT